MAPHDLSRLTQQASSLQGLTLCNHFEPPVMNNNNSNSIKIHMKGDDIFIMRMRRAFTSLNIYRTFLGGLVMDNLSRAIFNYKDDKASMF